MGLLSEPHPERKISPNISSESRKRSMVVSPRKLGELNNFATVTCTHRGPCSWVDGLIDKANRTITHDGGGATSVETAGWADELPPIVIGPPAGAVGW